MDDANFVSPLHGSCETRFEYRANGAVDPSQEDAAAERTIAVLGLRHEALVEFRERALRASGVSPRSDKPLSARRARELAAAILRADGEGRLPEYCVAIQQVAERYAEKEEQRARRLKGKRA